MAKTIKLEYDPQPKQALLHKCRARQILFGGAVGGGKSHALRWDCIAFCCENPCLLYTSPRPRDVEESRMPSSA